MSTMVALSKIKISGNMRVIEGVEDLHETPLEKFPLDEKAAILELAQSIQEHGLLNPLTVKDLGGGNFRLIAGYRRFKALQHNGVKVADVKSVKGKTEDEVVLRLIENVHRKDVNPLDIARTLEEIRKVKNIQKQAGLATLVKKSAAWVSQHLSLLKSDSEVQKALDGKQMGLAAARTISALPIGEQADAVKEAIKDAKESGKKKVSTKGAKKQAAKRKAGKNKQATFRPVAEREAEQKATVCEDFLAVYFGDKKVPETAKELITAFWDYLMNKNRLYISPK